MIFAIAAATDGFSATIRTCGADIFAGSEKRRGKSGWKSSHSRWLGFFSVVLMWAFHGNVGNLSVKNDGSYEGREVIC